MKYARFLVAALLLLALVAFAACRAAEDPVPPDPGVDPPAVAPPTIDPDDDDDDDDDGGVGMILDLDPDDIDPEHPLAALFAMQDRFPPMMQTGNTPIQGGHLRVAQVQATPITGLFNPVFSITVADSDIMAWAGIAASIFAMNPLRMMGQYGIARWEANVPEQSITITQQEEVFWHDGHPLTLDDLVFAIEVISHPDYVAAGGPRFGVAVTRIRGVLAFNAGEADYISGLVLSPDQRTLKIYFDDFPPSIPYFGFWSTPKPRHIWQDVPIADMPYHYHTRVNPIGWGPFIVDNIVPGESVHFVANENFWLGRPYLDEVTIQLVSNDMVPLMMLQGEFDIASWDLGNYPDFPHPTNFTYVADVVGTFGTFAFNLGYFVPAAQHPDGVNRIVPFDESYIGTVDIRLDLLLDVRFREAMNLATNVQTVADHVFEGLRFPAAGPIPPSHSAFISPYLRGVPFDPDRANELFDEMGLYWPAGSEFRVDQNGNPFHLRKVFAISPINEMVSMSYVQDWANVGIDVRADFRDHGGDIVPNINNAAGIREGFELSSAIWSPGADPNPNGLWGHSINNSPRFMNERWHAIMQDFNDSYAWENEQWLLERYWAFQDMFFDYWPSILLDWRISMLAVNNRVTNYEPFRIFEDGIRTRGGAFRIQVTSDTRYTD